MTLLDVDNDYGSDIDFQDLLPSDYGPEFDAEEETLIGAVLQRIAATAPTEGTSILSEGHEPDCAVLIHRASTAVVRLETTAGVALEATAAGCRTARQVDRNSASRGYRSAREPSATEDRSRVRSLEHASAPPDLPPNEDTRSPLERFRTRKPLSVTDLVSPAWCELQYSYVLSKFGRKPRTQAMKQGSKVHRVLEEQVHHIVPVQTQSKEDRFGLRLWNTIQGLRTLRETGLTRELDVWGTLHGQVVNGVIDELSYRCPDAQFEAALIESRKEKEDTVAKGQESIAHYFARAESSTASPSAPITPRPAVCIADVKTRGVKSVPSGASLRPTKMQLMLYRKLLESLARNDVDADAIFARYDLQPLEPFTETFITEIEGLDGAEHSQGGDQGVMVTRPTSEIRTHNNLSALWSLMITEFSHTVDQVSEVLRAEFRYSRDGEVIGDELFAYDAPAIEEYIATEISWWKGERPAVGVEIEEAFKCRMCDFADECSWRKDKIAEATEKHRLRVAGRAKSYV